MTKTKLLKLGISSLKLIFWLTLGLLLTFSMIPRGYAQSPDAAPSSQDESEPQTFPYKKTFIISSYYSPLPNQNKYFTGSFEGDVRLNGEGVTAADGTKVYPGIAAAARRFPFGTKMEIPGFGIVAIHDRGGAIKGNRLDIWVGAGEEGLRRAIAWGMRTVEVTVYGINDSIQESVNFTSMPLAEMSWIMTKTEYFKSDLSYGDEGESVRELQRSLKKLGYFSSDITGYFGDDTKEAVKQFQLAEKVIDSEADSGTGNFGPKSRIALERVLKSLRSEKLASLPSPNLSRGSAGESVRRLQVILKEYGFLDEVNSNFDQKTYDALLRFQLDFSVVKNRKDVGAGFYGPKTIAALKTLITDNFTPSASLISLKLNKTESVPPFSKTLAYNDRGSDVVLLQEELRRLNFLKLEPTGYFGETTRHAVFKMQQAFNIVEDKKARGAGVVGPKTNEKLNGIIAARTNLKKTVAQKVENAQILAARLNDEKTLVSGIVTTEAFSSDVAYGERGPHVEKLQKVLKRLGFFKGKLTTAYFGDITKSSLMAFQKDHGVEASGSLDISTRRILNTIISSPQPS